MSKSCHSVEKEMFAALRWLSWPVAKSTHVPALIVLVGTKMVAGGLCVA
jgi:hypothetical protein